MRKGHFSMGRRRSKDLSFNFRKGPSPQRVKAFPGLVYRDERERAAGFSAKLTSRDIPLGSSQLGWLDPIFQLSPPRSVLSILSCSKANGSQAYFHHAFVCLQIP